MNSHECKSLLFSLSEKAGIEEYEVYLMEVKNIAADALKDDIRSFQSDVLGGLCYRCIVDGKMGYASTEDLTEEAVSALVEKAVNNAKCIESDDKAFIFAGSDHYETPAPAPYAPPSAKELKETVLNYQKTVYEQSPLVADGTGCAAGAGEITIHLYNSKGLSLSTHGGYVESVIEAVVEKDGEKQQSYEMVTGPFGSFDLKEKARSAVENALARIGAKPVKTGKYDIVFSGRQMNSIVSTFISAFSAEQVQNGLSLLKGKVGEKVASDLVTYMDDPFYPGAPMQTAFDAEGVATKTKAVIENGVLKTFLYNLTTADKDNVESTGNGTKGSYQSSVGIAPYHFYLKPGEYSEDALFQTVQNGIYVTEMKGFHAGANPITGDFSIESAGFLIKDGKLADPICSFTVATNFFDFLKQIAGVGDTLKWSGYAGFTRFGSPAVWVKDLSVGGE